LFTANAAFFTQGDGNSLLGQEQRRRHADNTATNYHDAHTLGQLGVGVNKIDRWRHNIPRSMRERSIYPDSKFLTTEAWHGSQAPY